MPRPVRNSSNISALVEPLRFVSTRVCCWCSYVEVKTGGVSSSPMFSRSSTIQNSSSSSLRTGNITIALPQPDLPCRLCSSVIFHQVHLILNLEFKWRIPGVLQSQIKLVSCSFSPWSSKRFKHYPPGLSLIQDSNPLLLYDLTKEKLKFNRFKYNHYVKYTLFSPQSLTFNIYISYTMHCVSICSSLKASPSHVHSLINPK